MESIFIIALSNYDWPLLIPKNHGNDTPFEKSKKYLKTLVSKNESYLQVFDDLIDQQIWFIKKMNTVKIYVKSQLVLSNIERH